MVVVVVVVVGGAEANKHRVRRGIMYGKGCGIVKLNVLAVCQQKLILPVVVGAAVVLTAEGNQHRENV